MDLLTFLRRSLGAETSMRDLDQLSECWVLKPLRKGQAFLRQGDLADTEIILLTGRLVSCISDPDGQEICVGFYVAPCVVTPNIARCRESESLVTIEATTDAMLAHMKSESLTELMLQSQSIRTWANGILRDELGQKSEREWCLAALGGAERLAWFRRRFPAYEATFAHTLIASFLGMTPVTLSRLRQGNPVK